MIQIKPISTLLFVVLLTDWVHFTSSQPPLLPRDPYALFHLRLGQVIIASGPDVLPFSLKTRVVQDWLQTSNEFKDLCLQCDFELRHFDTCTPVMALIEAINRTFHHYVYSANTNFLVLESIKSGDPIGFNVYLTQNNVEISSPDFMQHATQFKATMNHRVRLLNMKTNDSYFDISDESDSSTAHNFLSAIRIPPTVRNEIATEYGPISDVSTDAFTDFFSEKMSRTMYRVRTTVDNYRTHYSADYDDVQILRGTVLRQEINRTIVNVLSHPICVRYRALNGRVYVYGRVKRVKLDTVQNAIIQKLYPFNTNIIPDMKTTFDNKHPAGGIFAIMYATKLLMGGSPAGNPMKLNEVWGDETLYMRIHLLNMLANRKLALLE